VAPQQRERRRPVGRGQDGEAVVLQGGAQKRPQLVVVFDDEHGQRPHPVVRPG
jgi:hypothetical protein